MDNDVGKIFVGGISCETSEESLKEYFSGYGEVVDAVVVKDKATGRSRGFGFVAFADPEVVDRILQEKHSVEGRVVECKRAVPRDEQHKFPRPSSFPSVPGPPSRTKKIFVGGLPSTLTEEDFREYFAQFGAITDVVVMYDHATQRPRGFGFITFESEDSVEKVVEKPFHDLHDKTVEVKKAIPKELSPGPSGSTNEVGHGFVGGRGTAALNAGFGQMTNINLRSTYGGAHNIQPSGVRVFSYGPPPFGSGYAAQGYGMAMNGAYAATPYVAMPGYAPVGGLALGYGTPAAAGYGAAAVYGVAGSPSSGYANTPAVPRRPWAGSGFVRSVSSGAYGAAATSAMSVYGLPSWALSSGSGQVATAFNAVGYAGLKYSSNATAGQSSCNPSGLPASFGEAYMSQRPYGETSWRPGESYSPPATACVSGAGESYSMIGGGPALVTDAAGYGAAGRQNRGSGGCVMPYPTSGKRVAGET